MTSRPYVGQCAKVSCGVLEEEATSRKRLSLLTSCVPSASSLTRGSVACQPNIQLPSQDTTPRSSLGLNNLGNTCFMNSIMQCLASTGELVGMFGRSDYLKHEGAAGGRLSLSLGELIRAMWGDESTKAVTPRAFLDCVIRMDQRFGGGRQHDSQEFLHCVLGGLQAELNRIKGKPRYKELKGKGTEVEQANEAWNYARSWHDSAIDDIFGGQLQSTVECRVCGHKSHCFDPFLDLSIPIPRKARLSSGHHLTVQDCLASFTATETLEGSDQYRCGKCKKVVPAFKKLSICRHPRVLVLHLKRFASSTYSFIRSTSLSKDTSHVNLVASGLNITKFCSTAVGATGLPPPIYDLYGVSNHSGTMSGGHYTALTESIYGDKWYVYNDSHVSPARSSDATTGSMEAYVLFYRLRTTQYNYFQE